MTRLMAQYWFGEALLGLVFGSILLMAALLEPTTEVVSLFGWQVPSLCAFRNLTGMGCPGCGLTRSFSFMAHGAPLEAFRMNAMGPFLYLAFATQPPFRLYTILRDLRERSRALEAA
ncbi:MAG: DUF2752 domain-containing protein [Myxococcales bacterium]|nr:DUF2752 domain-containing protein [Myxococcales bacterium]MCB9671742.1 DUF2752 domain-containing protein [Alphaproteobacteria bacterium]